MLVTWYVDQNQHFLTYFAKNSLKIVSSYDYYFYSLCTFSMFKILRSRLHYDVIVTSYAGGCHLFWYQRKEETHSYTVVANIRVQNVYLRKCRGELQPTPPPPSENVLQKMARDSRRGLIKNILENVREIQCNVEVMRKTHCIFERFGSWRKIPCA